MSSQCMHYLHYIRDYIRDLNNLKRTKNSYLQSSPVGAVGGPDDTLLLNSLKAQGKMEALVLLIHLMEVF